MWGMSHRSVWRCLFGSAGMCTMFQICLNLSLNKWSFQQLCFLCLLVRHVDEQCGTWVNRKTKGFDWALGLEVNVGADIVFFFAVAYMMVVLTLTCHHSEVILWRLLGWDSTDLEQRVKATLFHHSNDKDPTYRGGKSMRDEGSSLQRAVISQRVFTFATKINGSISTGLYKDKMMINVVV